MPGLLDDPAPHTNHAYHLRAMDQNPLDRPISRAEALACLGLVGLVHAYGSALTSGRSAPGGLPQVLGEVLAFGGIIYLSYLGFLGPTGLGKPGRNRAALLASSVAYFFFAGPPASLQRALELWYVLVVWAAVIPVLVFGCRIRFHHALLSTALTTVIFVCSVIAMLMIAVGPGT